MPPNLRNINPLDWRSVVGEAIRRRKEEGMTQKEHAALAGVSVPTIVAFDRGEVTLSLGKAFDILRVVGLVIEPDKAGTQGAFVQDAYKRWRELTASLPQTSPARFPDGWYRFDYALEGDLKELDLETFKKRLEEAVVPFTGWPLFLFLTRHILEPHEVDDVIECWLKPGTDEFERALDNAAHCDFWRASPQGRAFIMRGYQEDTQDTFPPHTVFDTTLPIWRMAEALTHAKNLGRLIAEDPEKMTIRFRALYTGLSGRVLRSWANPLADLFVEGGAARSDEASLETSISLLDVENDLAKAVHPLVASLFERFGITGLTVDRVRAEVERMIKGRFHSGKR
ncbi:MAG: helix-turn-helix domain-containing protein [Proteobacteria bacterium]|nr:helix-turn-helix domain-containing protein [Pseudomonadota bacterium]